MTVTFGRITVWTTRGRSTKPRGRKALDRGPYGAWTFTWPWSWFTRFSMQVWRRYPDSRLRCNQCGYRENDA